MVTGLKPTRAKQRPAGAGTAAAGTPVPPSRPRGSPAAGAKPDLRPLPRFGAVRDLAEQESGRVEDTALVESPQMLTQF